MYLSVIFDIDGVYADCNQFNAKIRSESHRKMLKQEELINDAKHNRLAGKKERRRYYYVYVIMKNL